MSQIANVPNIHDKKITRQVFAVLAGFHWLIVSSSLNNAFYRNHR